MAKQIDEQELVNTKHISNSFGEFTVLECIGKIKTQYCYNIQFTTTGNIEITTRKSILDKTCVDKKEKEKIIKANKAKRTQEEFARRKKMNQFKGKASFQCTNPNDLMVLALDQSTRHTGYSVWKGRKLISYGVIDLETNDYSYLEKALTIESVLCDIIKEHKIELVVMEDIYLGFNLEVFKVLNTLQSHLMLTFIKMKLPYIIVSAIQWKSFANITVGSKTRELQKKAGLIIVRNKYGITDISDDISDSILIGEYAISECVKPMPTQTSIWDFEIN